MGKNQISNSFSDYQNRLIWEEICDTFFWPHRPALPPADLPSSKHEKCLPFFLLSSRVSYSFWSHYPFLSKQEIRLWCTFLCVCVCVKCELLSPPVSSFQMFVVFWKRTSASLLSGLISVVCVCCFVVGEPMVVGEAGVWDNYCVKKQLLHSWWDPLLYRSHLHCFTSLDIIKTSGTCACETSRNVHALISGKTSDRAIPTYVLLDCYVLNVWLTVGENHLMCNIYSRVPAGFS